MIITISNITPITIPATAPEDTPLSDPASPNSPTSKTIISDYNLSVRFEYIKSLHKKMKFSIKDSKSKVPLMEISFLCVQLSIAR